MNENSREGHGPNYSPETNANLGYTSETHRTNPATDNVQKNPAPGTEKDVRFSMFPKERKGKRATARMATKHNPQLDKRSDDQRVNAGKASAFVNQLRSQFPQKWHGDVEAYMDNIINNFEKSKGKSKKSRA